MGANGSGKAKRWLAPCRFDYLMAKVIVGGVVLGSVIFGLVRPVIAAVTNSPLPVSYTTRVTGIDGVPGRATHDGIATVQLLLHDATGVERFLQAFPGLLIAGLAIAVACMLFQLIRTTQEGEPFIRRNVRRLRAIAWIAILIGLPLQVSLQMADAIVLPTPRLPFHPATLFGMPFALAFSLVGILVLLIGEVFRRGVELRDDVEGLV